MSLTLTDMFCGAGGSSTGAIQVPGIEVRTAMNHWDLAIETHNTNHPDATHVQADISQTDPRYVRRSDILWASPECTNHSRAKGRKQQKLQDALWEESLPDEAAELSRATMWDVLRFAEVHRYAAIVVENVVEVVDWIFYPAWRAGLEAGGYRVQVVSLNSMHAQQHGDPAPQSRDRVYFVCTRKGNPVPDVRPRPWAWCPTCDEPVRAIQSFKRPDAVVGRYRSQYVYRCPSVTCRNRVVEPAWLPAATIIDWALPGQRIGDRAKPLAAKTRARIAAGIARYWGPLHLEAAGNTYDAADPKHPQHGNPNSYYRAWSTVEPLRTLHTIESKAIAVPTEGRAGVAAARDVEDVLRTQTTRETTALVMRNNEGGAEMTTPVIEPVRTITTTGHQSLLTADDITAAAKHVDDVLFRMLEPGECKRAMAFPGGYVMHGNRREQVKLAGNAVTPPAARDLIAAVAATLGAAA